MEVNLLAVFVTFMGFMMSVGYYPQAYKVWKTKSARDVSLFTYIIFAFGTLTWTIYGFVQNDWVIVVSFIVGVIGSWLVLILTLCFKK